MKSKELTIGNNLSKIWLIKDEVCYFPYSWDKDQVMDLVNNNYIHICEICGKIDITYRHYNKHYFK